MFVKFLEMESTPSLPAPKLPVHDLMPLSAPPPGKTSGSAPAAAGKTHPEKCNSQVSFSLTYKFKQKVYFYLFNLLFFYKHGTCICTKTSFTLGTGASIRRAGESTLFLAPRSTAVPLLSGSGSSSSGGHLLMKPISDALPTFTPVPVSAEASGGAVLKDLLKQ